MAVLMAVTEGGGIHTLDAVRAPPLAHRTRDGPAEVRLLVGVPGAVAEAVAEARGEDAVGGMVGAVLLQEAAVTGPIPTLGWTLVRGVRAVRCAVTEEPLVDAPRPVRTHAMVRLALGRPAPTVFFV